MADELKGLDFDSALEVGTQWGECLMAIKERFPDKKLVGVDIDEETLKIAREITDLDLRYMNALHLDFKQNEFDVVFSEAFLCMLPATQVDSAIRKIIQVAKKYIILVELTRKSGIGETEQGKERVGANWKEIFDNYGLTAEVKKIPEGVWEVEPWKSYGCIVTVKI